MEMEAARQPGSLWLLLRRKTFYQIISVTSLIGIWQLTSLASDLPFLPTPVEVASATLSLLRSKGTYEILWVTFFRVIVSAILGLAFSLLGGILLGSRQWTEDLFGFWVVFGLSIPAPAMGMMGLIWFGLGEWTLIFAVTVTIIPFMINQFWQGVKALDMSLVEMGQVFQLRRFRIILDIVLPQLYPYFFATLRYGFGMAWKVVVIVEVIAASQGVGVEMQSSYRLIQPASTVAWTAIFIAVMMAMESGGFSRLENYLIRYRRASE